MNHRGRLEFENYPTLSFSSLTGDFFSIERNPLTVRDVWNDQAARFWFSYRAAAWCTELLYFGRRNAEALQFGRQPKTLWLKNSLSVGKFPFSMRTPHSGIKLHQARIQVPGQGLDHFLRLMVIKHVHDIAVPERVRCHRNLKVYPVSFSQFRMVSSVTAHSSSRQRGQEVTIQLSISLT